METGYIVAGFAVGVLIGLTGIGGGSLMTPILILVFGIHPSAAVGTDLLFASVTKTVGTAIHGAQHSVAWRIAARLSLGSLPGAGLALAALRHAGVHGRAANRSIMLLLGIVLLISAAALVLRPWMLRLVARRHAGAGPREASAWATIAIGFIVGILVTICSVGAGSLGTVALLILYPRLPVARIVGSDIAHAVPLTLLSGLGHWWLGGVDLMLLAPLLLGSVPGIVLGSVGARIAPEPALQIVLAIVMVFTGLKLMGV